MKATFASPPPGRCYLSPESDIQVTDDRKRKRMISNRESARRSRMKKQLHLEELINEATRLQRENAQMKAQMNSIIELHVSVAAEATVLRAQYAELADRLQWAKSLLSTLRGFGGEPMPSLEDLLLNPYNPPFSAPPVPTATGIFQF